MSGSLREIHMFWHGAPLSRMERLCMTSFIAQGHALNLFVYDHPEGVPYGVRVRNAAEILPREYLFVHRRTGSVAIFSDWFRYRLLRLRGGIWADTDIVCLKPLDYSQPEIFAWEDEKAVNGAVLGLPPGHRVATLLEECCANPNRLLPYDGLKTKLRKWRRRYLQGNRRERQRWGEYGPKGLTAALRHFGLLGSALPAWHFYPVHFTQWRQIFEAGKYADLTALDRSYALHLSNNKVCQYPGMDKNSAFPPDSLYERLCRKYL